MQTHIAIEHFSKNFDGVEAVKNISLSVSKGELFGLIGPDGAGKTTTMRSLCTLLPVEQGELSIVGLDVRKEVRRIRSRIGYMPQRFSLYPDLSVEQNLLFFADLFGVPKQEKFQRLQELYHFSKLEPFKKRLAKQLSGGMKQKLALSCTLIHTPEVLILDEPTTGVDPVSRREFWLILKKLRDDGVTILVSTPYMDEALLCDRVAFMHKGQILALDKPDKIGRLFPYALYEISSSAPQKIQNHLQSQPSVQTVHIFGDRVHASFRESLSAEQLATIQRTAPEPIAAMRQIEPGIEDTFLELMKQVE
ncbi:MAG: ABC transporter ATP-binding protein [Deferribacteres bacterium]|nr:ABC transporter ATP-binding protein [candidate division KSB1 bacterium]MCB9509074.1 ABC transporter ATP-binding protein [Deferribacteres bacterium]